MSDEDYPAYLKKQSYDDLVSISCSINKETQANRYQMVLAEIAVRDQRGEKPTANWQGNATLVLGGFFIFEFIMDLVMSRPVWRVFTDLVLGVTCLLIAWFCRKKGKDEKPAA
ncbi:MAG TPA: hypothetical protein VK815_06285 [Candidatus Acidoferrales bacterium]|jgi:hypothetical protein|nr:hypothetical protein [Candidatus Acidoferrales bacterium]